MQRALTTEDPARYRHWSVAYAEEYRCELGTLAAKKKEAHRRRSCQNPGTGEAGQNRAGSEARANRAIEAKGKLAMREAAKG